MVQVRLHRKTKRQVNNQEEEFPITTASQDSHRERRSSISTETGLRRYCHPIWKRRIRCREVVRREVATTIMSQGKEGISDHPLKSRNRMRASMTARRKAAWTGMTGTILAWRHSKRLFRRGTEEIVWDRRIIRAPSGAKEAREVQTLAPRSHRMFRQMEEPAWAQIPK